MEKEIYQQKQQQLERVVNLEKQVDEAVVLGFGLSAVPFINEYNVQEWRVVDTQTAFGIHCIRRALQKEIE